LGTCGGCCTNGKSLRAIETVEFFLKYFDISALH